MGLYLYSRPINQFFKRSIILRSKRFDHWIFDSSLWNQFRTISEFFWKKKEFRSWWIFAISVRIRGNSFSYFMEYKDSYTNAINKGKGNPIWFVRTTSIESLHLSLFRFLNSCFPKNRIWLRIAHFLFQGFSEFGSYHLVGFHTKAQSNQVRSVYQFRHIPL